MCNQSKDPNCHAQAKRVRRQVGLTVAKGGGGILPTFPSMARDNDGRTPEEHFFRFEFN